MAKVHDKFVIELAEVIKGYGNDPDVEDPFRLSEFYRFYELPNIAVSRENFEKMRPIEERKKGKWIYTRPYSAINCSSCHHCSWSMPYEDLVKSFNYCPNCGADMRGREDE